MSKLGTSYGYLQKLAGGFGMPSLEFAQQMKAVVPELDVECFIRAKEFAAKRKRAKAS